MVSDFKQKYYSFKKNFFSLETNYFTVGGLKKSLKFFIKSGKIYHHLLDRLRFHIYPKFLISANFPTHLEVEVASKCQMRCPMCWTTYLDDKMKGLMKFELYKKIIDEASGNNVFSIKLSWRGEPLLNPKLIEMINYAKEKKIKSVAFLTNAELLTENMSDKILQTDLDWVSISADGVDEIYDKIRFPAKFQETLKKVEYLKKTRDRLKKNKPLIRVQSIASAVKNNAEKFYKSWEPITDKINIIADQIRDYTTETEKLEFDKYFICPKPFQRLAIAHTGLVHQCIADYGGKNILGDINKQTIMEVWNGEPNKKLRKSFKDHTYYKINSACKECSYGLVQVKDSIGFDKSNNIKLNTNKFKSVPDIVEEKVKLTTPIEKIPQNKRGEYSKVSKN
jgi:radical SAM protein with 4Fe4S-binding SPASM domain